MWGGLGRFGEVWGGLGSPCDVDRTVAVKPEDFGCLAFMGSNRALMYPTNLDPRFGFDMCAPKTDLRSPVAMGLLEASMLRWLQGGE